MWWRLERRSNVLNDFWLLAERLWAVAAAARAVRANVILCAVSPRITHLYGPFHENPLFPHGDKSI